MNHLFQVTVYTGQQLVLEALQRWLARPCVEPEGQRQRRAGIRSLIVLLLKTAATGVLATILDAAIEYRRRQLLATVDHEAGASSQSLAEPSRFGLGTLSRAGIAAWKAKLLLAIDEMERQALHYGIAPSHRFTPSTGAEDKIIGMGEKKESEEEGGSGSSGSGSGGGSFASGQEEEQQQQQQQNLAATVEQLQQLASKINGGGTGAGTGEDDDDDVERSFDQRVDLLLDELLGNETPATFAFVSEGLKASASHPRLLSLSRSVVDMASLKMKSTPATASLLSSASSSSGAEDPDSPVSTTATTPTTKHMPMCHICMDRVVGVRVAECRHELCFQCARRLCATQDHQLPQCPFCRQPINGFSSYAVVTAHGGAAVAASAVEV